MINGSRLRELTSQGQRDRYPGTYGTIQALLVSCSHVCTFATVLQYDLLLKHSDDKRNVHLSIWVKECKTWELDRPLSKILIICFMFIVKLLFPCVVSLIAL